jgi:hypothetical protein
MRRVTVEWRDRASSIYGLHQRQLLHGINGGVSHYGIIQYELYKAGSTATYTSVLCGQFQGLYCPK